MTSFRFSKISSSLSTFKKLGLLQGPIKVCNLYLFHWQWEDVWITSAHYLVIYRGLNSQDLLFIYIDIQSDLISIIVI